MKGGILVLVADVTQPYLISRSEHLGFSDSLDIRILGGHEGPCFRLRIHIIGTGEIGNAFPGGDVHC